MNLITLFQTAQKNLHFPRIKYPFNNGYIEIHIAKKANEDPYFPNYLYISFNKEYIGKITRDNKLIFTQGERDPLLEKTIIALHQSPFESCQIFGQQFSYCCFCGTEITSKNSLAVGYGPYCADKWGLPWEGMAKEKERIESNKYL